MPVTRLSKRKQQNATMRDSKTFQSQIKVPLNVNCELKDGRLFFYGPLGSSSLSFKATLNSQKSVFDSGRLSLIENQKQVGDLSHSKELGRGAKGLQRARVASQEGSNDQTLRLSFKDKSILETAKKLTLNRFHGVKFGFTLYLRVVGVGYRVSYRPQNHRLVFKVGFSHDVEFQLPASIRVFILEPTLFCLFGINKDQVGQVAAKIRMIRRPEVYKGKGIRFVEEKVKLIQGKRK